MEHFESRISTLEEKARAQENLNEHYSAKLDAIAAGISRLETLVALSNAKACPSPGKCLVLEADANKLRQDVVAMQSDVEDIKQYIAEQKGGWKALALIAGAAGTVGSFLGWLFSTFHINTKGPNP